MPSGSQNVWQTRKTPKAIATTIPPSQAIAASRARIPASRRPCTNDVGVPASLSRNAAGSAATGVAGAAATGVVVTDGADVVPGAAGAGGSSGSGNFSRNSRAIVSASRPRADAYARMNERRKIPEGQRETSPRSSASNSDALIFVLAEIDSSAIRLRSRSRRSCTHHDRCGVLSSETIAMATRMQVRFRLWWWVSLRQPAPSGRPTGS